jgi:NAD(P)-dependent dehydrogenase (short-subunit alcohol dehydrogenase family)
MPNPLLAGKRCLIIGGTGGLGAAAVARFLDEGASVVVTGHEPAARASLAAVPFVTCDVTSPEQVEGLVRQSISLLGGLDVLYHVAGGSGRRHGDGPLHACTEEGWSFTLALNLTGVFRTNKAVLQHFLSRPGGGVILNLASVLALSPAPDYFDTAAYSAAKGGIIALSRQAAARYAPQGIRVNVLAPGLIDTPMAARAVADPQIRRYLQGKQPLAPGPGSPEDCAGAAAFLCSESARFITGAVLPVDGGWCVREGFLVSGDDEKASDCAK